MSKFTAVVATIAAATVAYAAYFDYARRHDANFRKSLRKSAKFHAKLETDKENSIKSAKVAQVKQVLEESLRDEPLPTNPTEKETYFMTQVTQGEQLAAVPGNEIPAALAFYRALSVYPNPTDILSIYQKSIPGAVYDYIITMIAIKPPQSVASFLGGADAGVATDAATAATIQEQD